MFQTLSITLHSQSTSTDKNQQVSITTEFDIFEQPAQKIVVVSKKTNTVGDNAFDGETNIQISSTGFNLNIEYLDLWNLNVKTYSGEYTTALKYRLGNSNYDNKLSLKGNKERLDVLLKIFNSDLLKVSNKHSFSKERQNVDSEISSYGSNPVITHLDIKNFNTLLFTIGYKSELYKKLLG